MLEFTGMGSVLRGLGFLYWTLAIGAVVLAIRNGKSTRSKVIWAIVAIAVFGFYPAKRVIEYSIEKRQHDAFAAEAWAYYQKKCATESGEKIYKSVPGVKSVLVVKPLPLATVKDDYDQFWVRRSI